MLKRGPFPALRRVPEASLQRSNSCPFRQPSRLFRCWRATFWGVPVQRESTCKALGHGYAVPPARYSWPELCGKLLQWAQRKGRSQEICWDEYRFLQQTDFRRRSDAVQAEYE